jgi:hypothetical protein
MKVNAFNSPYQHIKTCFELPYSLAMKLLHEIYHVEYITCSFLFMTELYEGSV